MQLVMNEAQVQVGTGANGTRVIIAIDKQSGLQVVITLDESGAKAVGAALTTGLLIASGPLGGSPPPTHTDGRSMH